MDALDDENILLSKLQHFAFVFPLTGLKVKPWKFDGLAGEQSVHILIKLRNIHTPERLKIRLSVLIERILFPVAEIIVHGDRMRIISERCKLRRKPMAECCFSRRRRSCDHHDPAVRILHGLFRNLTDILLLECLLHQDQILSLPVRDHLIQSTDIWDLKTVTPAIR